MNEKLIAQVVIGYMIKVMKLGLDISIHKDIFASIRHGNYDEFIELINTEKPWILAYKDGIITNQENTSQKTHGDFAGLILSGTALKRFYYNISTHYGPLIDTDITDEIYQNVALYELVFRMHANNNNLIDSKEELVNVIKKVSLFKNISDNEIQILQKGREFINDIKHHNKPKYKRKFTSWLEGSICFNQAYIITKKYEINII